MKKTLTPLYAAAALGVTALSSTEVNAQSQPQGFHDMRYAMEVQLTPYTDPANPQSRMVEIDCTKLFQAANGNVGVTGEFVRPFDLPPLRSPNPTNHPVVEGTYTLAHIGSMTNPAHQICIANSQILQGNPEGLPTPFTSERKIAGSYRETSVPYNDDRYCAPVAAMRICTIRTDDDENISPVYDLSRLESDGIVTLNRQELQNVPPELQP